MKFLGFYFALIYLIRFPSEGKGHFRYDPAFKYRQVQSSTIPEQLSFAARSPSILLNPRGGSLYPPPTDDYYIEGDSSDEGDEMYDEDIDNVEEDEGAAMHQHRRDQASPSGTPRTGNQEGAENSNPFMRKAPYPPRKKKKKNALSRMATSSLSLTRKAAATTVKTSGKAAFYLMRPKSIQEHELWGVWRLDQQVGTKQCTANVELTKRGEVVVRSGEEILWKSRYRFVQPTWPQSCRIEFEAPAFQPPNSNKKPWMLRYKGTIERKVADKSVLKIVGTLYDIERPKGMFGKELPTRYNKIGSFVGRRRIVLQEEMDEEEEYSDVEEEGEEEGDDKYDPEDDPYYGDPYYGESGGEEEAYSDDHRM